MSAGSGVSVEAYVEDVMLESFVRRSLLRFGINARAIRMNVAPSGEGSAKAWVTKGYADWLRKFRSQKHQENLVLLIGTDADELLVNHRISQLEETLQPIGHKLRSASEKVVYWIPKWNIETWILHFQGDTRDENANYKNAVSHPVPFKDVAREFVNEYHRFKSNSTGVQTLDSLHFAHNETTRFIP